MAYRSLTRDRSVAGRKVNRALVRRILGYAAAYRGLIIVFLITLVLVSLLSVAQPLLIPRLVDQGLFARQFSDASFLDIGTPDDYARAESLFSQ